MEILNGNGMEYITELCQATDAVKHMKMRSPWRPGVARPSKGSLSRWCLVDEATA